jgi:polysaccharide export outer membrane protein
MRQTTSFRRFVFLAAAAVALAAPAGASAQALAGNGSAGARTGAAETVPDYKLVPGDKLRIEVYKDAQLSQSIQIRPDGKITLPLIGDITAVNQTPTELRNVITNSLKDYMTNPSVTVIVVETVVPTAYVMGEVRAPGAVPLQGEVSILQALALTGGLTEFAKVNDIRILRKTSLGVDTIMFRYKDAVKGDMKAQLYLRPGDTVIVP